ncbi:MAG: glycosyltransferase [Candidatus Eisenbacteria bacterium]|uniref:Glycosyltransferase n=1 Tax=Eiseniibacteriota bacterium TaxID=2212470 RepID=A0A948RWS5_UNCEI|nr:glycosyltransferase [Candidatus Eisenbacteria bacterium]
MTPIRTTPVHITMVTGGPFPALGGAEIQALRLAKALKESGYQIEIMCLNAAGAQKRNEFVDSIPVHRVGVFTFSTPGGKHRLGSLSSFPAVFTTMLRRKPRPHLIHLHLLTRATLAAALAGRFMGIPVIAKLGNSGRRFDFRQIRETYFEGALLAYLFKQSISAFIAPSSAVSADLLNEGIKVKDIVSIPNGVDLEYFSREAAAPSEAPPGFTFVYTGTLKKKKNLHILIEAFAKAQADAGGRLNLIIVGDGPERRTLETLAAEHHLTGRITFAGGHQDVRPWLSLADAFVLPSEAEGLPNALMEAMAFSLPAIATGVGGSLELIDPARSSFASPPGRFYEARHGILVTPGDIQGLAGALTKMAENAERNRVLGESARRHIEENYTLTNIAKKYEELYQSLI